MFLTGETQGVQCSPEERLKQIRTTCDQIQANYNDTIFRDAKNFARFFVLKQEKTIYCGMQSTGAKGWRQIIDEALELKPGETSNPQLMWQNKKLKEKGIGYLSEFTIKDIRAMLEDPSFKKVLVIKHPLARFVAAYDMRVKNGPLWKIKKLKKTLEEKLKEPVSGFNVTFTQFVKYVINEDSLQADRYWQTFQYLCFPCVVKFDDVIKSETNNNVDNTVDTYVDGNKGTSKMFPTARSLFVYRWLDKDLMSGLLRHYERDMKMFGYGWAEPWYKATCKQPSVDPKVGECC